MQADLRLQVEAPWHYRITIGKVRSIRTCSLLSDWIAASFQRTLPLFEATLAYAAAKAALTNYSKGLSKEFSPKGIRINTVAPGYTETQAAQGMVNEIAQRTGVSTDAARQRIMDSLGGIPLGRPNR